MRRRPRSSRSSTGAFNQPLMRCNIARSTTRRATLWSNSPCGILWLVGTGLGAVAFAEPGRAVPFETGASPSRHGTLNPSPHAEPGVQVSRTGLPRSHLRGRSDSGMTKLRVRQLEPCAAPEIAPVQPMSLAAAAQHSNPLQLDFTPNDVKSWLAVV